MARELSKTRNVKDTSYSSARLGVLGKSGRGKTGTLSGDSDHLIIDTEGGAKLYDTMYREKAGSIQDLREITSALNSLASKPNFPYSGVYIDTIDKVVDFAERETIAKARYEARIWNDRPNCKSRIDPNKIIDMFTVPNELFNGWNYRTGLVMGVLDQLDGLPCARGFVGHIQTKQVEEEDGSKHDITTINIGGKLGSEILAWTDHTLFIHGVMAGKEMKRWIRTTPSRGLECKSRDGLIPDMLEFPVGNNNAQNWQIIRKCFT